MSQDNRFDPRGKMFSPPAAEGGEKRGDLTSRARNRTVMLSPELTDELRGVLGGQESPRGQDAISELLPTGGWDEPTANRGGFEGEHSGGENGTPAGFFSTGGEGTRFVRPGAASHRGVVTSQGMSGSGNSFGLRGAPVVGSGQESGSGAFTRPGLRSPQRPAESKPGATAHGTARRNYGNEGAGFAPEAQSFDHVMLSTPRETRLVGFLVSFDKPNGETVELRVGRYFISSQPTDQADYILVPDDSVSPLHAIIRVTAEGAVQVMDQLSERGSWLRRAGTQEEQELVGTTVSVAHGDCVRFGSRVFIVCMVPQISEPAPVAASKEVEHSEEVSS